MDIKNQCISVATQHVTIVQVEKGPSKKCNIEASLGTKPGSIGQIVP